MRGLLQSIIGHHLPVIELVQFSEEMPSQLSVSLAHLDVVTYLLQVDGC
jgi:hypothetical protein